MREPFPEHARRTLEACRQNPAREVLSSRGWAELREHCGELAIELDALGRRTIAQRVDRDYARLHGQLREATAAGWARNRLLLADAVEELASTLAALQRFQAALKAARASDELERFRQPAKAIIIWLELHCRSSGAKRLLHDPDQEQALPARPAYTAPSFRESRAPATLRPFQGTARNGTAR